MSSQRRFSAYLCLAMLTILFGGCSGCGLGLCDGGGGGGGGSDLPPPVLDVVVVAIDVTSPTTALTSLGSTVQFQADARNASGFIITGPTFTWISSNTDVVTVNPSGLATAVANGTVTITATTDGIQGSARLTVSQAVATIAVTPVGPLTLAIVDQTESLTAVANDAGGAEVFGVTFAWASDNTAVATVAADGTVTALADGVATITASASFVTSNPVAVTVTP